MLGSTLQETVVACIALCDDDNANYVAAQIEPTMFDPPMDDIVARCLEYRERFKRAPGKTHIDDVLSHILENREHELFDTYLTVLNSLLEISRIDTEFVRYKVGEYVKLRKYKDALEAAIIKYNNEGINGLDDVDDLLRGILRNQEDENVGFTLRDPNALGFLYRDDSDSCPLKIKELDNVGCIPTKKEMLVFLAPRNKGKSMFATHCGKMALLHGWRIAHYTLENSKEMTAQRYFQSIFGGAKRNDGEFRSFKFSNNIENVKIETDEIKPDFIVNERESSLQFLKDQTARKFNKRLENLWIREFPTGKLTFNKLEKDLDQLSSIHKFTPDMVIVDYPQMMKYKRGNNEYTYLDEIYVKLRGLAVERNVSMVCLAQGNRNTEKANTVYSSDIAGDIGIVAIADNIISYSQTAEEELFGLARLRTEKVRNDRARQMIFITQMYSMSQFCLSSTPYTKAKMDYVKKFGNSAVKKPETEPEKKIDGHRERPLLRGK